MSQAPNPARDGMQRMRVAFPEEVTADHVVKDGQDLFRKGEGRSCTSPGDRHGMDKLRLEKKTETVTKALGGYTKSLN